MAISKPETKRETALPTRASGRAGAFVALMLLVFVSVMAPRPAVAQCEVPGVTIAAASAITAANTASLYANYMAPTGILPAAWTVSITIVQGTLIAALKVFEDTLFNRLRKFWDDYLQALKDQTAELNGSITDGTRQLNSLMDTSSMGSNQRALQMAQTQAKKDYQPTEEGCRFDTAGKYMATTTRIRRAAQSSLGGDLASVGMNTKGSDAALGPAAFEQVRWHRYATVFCDPDANGGKPGCSGGPLAAADVEPSKTFFGRETIPMDTDDNWRVAANELTYNITGYKPNKPVPKDALESSIMQDRRAEQRAYATQMDAVSALVTDVIADRTPGPAAPEIKQLRQKEGISDASDHPSAREIRQSVIEQLWDPNYYVNLQDGPASTSRKELYLSAYNLMLLNLIVEKTEKIANALAVETSNLLDFGQGDKRTDLQIKNPVR